MTKANKKYYPNNWKKYYDSPSHWFEGLEYEEFMSWKMHGWELPSSVDCIIREEDYETGKIKEYVYSKASSAKKRVDKIMASGNGIVLATKESLHHVFPITEEDYEDNYDGE